MENKEKQPFRNFIESLGSVDNIETLFVKPSKIPKPKDDIELDVQNLVIKNGLPYDQAAVDSLSATIRSAERTKSWKISKLLWIYIVIMLWGVFQREKSKMTAMKIAFLYGVAFHESMKWEEVEEDDFK